ncbi:MAG: MFS transporter, partial [Acidimicrobiales bacterium]
LERGAERIVSADDVERAGGTDSTGAPTGETALGAASPATGTAASDHDVADTPPPPGDVETQVLRLAKRQKLDLRRGVVLDDDPMDLGWWQSIRYVVAVHSNVTLIVASALGYFFFGGVETFALIYIEGHFGVGQAYATIIALVVGTAAVAGAVVGGRLTDHLLDKGRIAARLMVPAAAFVVAGVVFVPGIVSKSLIISIPLFLVAGFCIAAPNPGLDAARLDIMPSRMWGRAEAVRSFLRSILQSFAPLIFGFVSTFFGGSHHGFGVSGGGLHSQASSSAGLEPTFLIMLVTLFAAAAIVWTGRKPYPVDVAAAAETERRFPPVKDTSSPAHPADSLASTRD